MEHRQTAWDSMAEPECGCTTPVKTQTDAQRFSRAPTEIPTEDVSIKEEEDSEDPALVGIPPLPMVVDVLQGSGRCNRDIT
jgi:hypothetical protein